MSNADVDLGTAETVVRRAIDMCRPLSERWGVVMSSEPTSGDVILKFDIARGVEPTR
jgi:hypothetical protein